MNQSSPLKAMDAAAGDARPDQSDGVTWKGEKLEEAVSHEDDLMDCLVYLSAHHGRPKSAESLMAGLPDPGEAIKPAAFIRAAERSGFNAKIVKRSLKSISKHVLPVVIMLADGRAGVLKEYKGKKSARVMLPSLGGGDTNVSLSELEKAYVGYAIFMRPVTQFELYGERADIPKPSSWFWGTLVQSWWSYTQVGVAAIFINLFALASPLFIMTVYDRVIPNNAEETLWVLAIGVLSIIAFDFILKTLRAYFIDTAGKKADVMLACRLFDQVLDMKLKSRPASSGAFANKLREFESLRDFFTSATLVALIDLPFVGLFVLVLWLVAGNLALVLAAAIPIVLLYGIFIQFPLSFVVRKNLKEAEQKHGVLIEAINGLETVKGVGADGRMRGMWETAVGLTSKSSQKARALSMSATNFTAMCQQAVSVAVVLYGVHLIGEGEITVGALIACVMLGGRAIAPMGQVAGLLTRFNQSMVSLKSLNEIMEAEVERPASKKFLHRPVLEGAITFDKVKFTYPGRDTPILDNVSFSIKPGERIGLIGRVGSGKTTISKLIMGLYEPDEGAILMDGTDLRQIDPADLRRNIGYVPQDTFLFRGTVRDNITTAAPNAEDAEIIRAAKLSGVEEFISQDPMGFDMPVGERGDGLSGGQRQAVTLARAFLRNPNTLVLDEPTSAMDTKSESLLKEKLTNYLKGHTLVLVTHRASLLHFVDRVIVMDHGKVVADGNRKDIIEALASGRISTASGGS